MTQRIAYDRTDPANTFAVVEKDSPGFAPLALGLDEVHRLVLWAPTCLQPNALASRLMGVR